MTGLQDDKLPSLLEGRRRSRIEVLAAHIPRTHVHDSVIDIKGCRAQEARTRSKIVSVDDAVNGIDDACTITVGSS